MMCGVFRRLKSWSLTKRTALGAVVRALPLSGPKAVQSISGLSWEDLCDMCDQQGSDRNLVKGDVRNGCMRWATWRAEGYLAMRASSCDGRPSTRLSRGRGREETRKRAPSRVQVTQSGYGETSRCRKPSKGVG